MEQDGLLVGTMKELRNVKGVKALVLGGSRARGTNSLKSDFDICLYYDPDDPLDMDHLSEVATRLDDEHRSGVVTRLGGWGPWINGGGWLRVQHQPVDLIYRNLVSVWRVVEDCHNGKVQVYYQPGHPFGFVSSIYMAELAVCRPLWDPQGIVARGKQATDPYPRALQKALIDLFFWEADFSLKNGYKAVELFDVPYLGACIFRSTGCLLQVLFALNEHYWLNEKGALSIAEKFPFKPEQLTERINYAYRLLAINPKQAQEALDGMEGLVREVRELIAQC